MAPAQPQYPTAQPTANARRRSPPQKGPTACQRCATKKLACRREGNTKNRCEACEKSNKECVEQISARERGKEPDTPEKLMAELLKLDRKRDGLIERLRACPGGVTEYHRLRAAVESNTDAVEGQSIPLLHTAAPSEDRDDSPDSGAPAHPKRRRLDSASEPPPADVAAPARAVTPAVDREPPPPMPPAPTSRWRSVNWDDPGTYLPNDGLMPW